MNTKNPFISVVIPAFNEEKYLPSCLDALKKQTFKDFEVIVVDNNSTDNTAKIAQSFGARLVKEKNQGMTPARQKGFQVAKGQIIARLDADCSPKANWLKDIVRLLEKNPDAIAVTGGLEFYDAFWGKVVPRILNFWWFGAKILMGHFPLTGPNFAVRASVLKKIKPHTDDRLVHEDMDLSCHIAPFGKIIYISKTYMPSSARRWKKDFSYTSFDYVKRAFRTIFLHHKFMDHHHRNI